MSTSGQFFLNCCCRRDTLDDVGISIDGNIQQLVSAESLDFREAVDTNYEVVTRLRLSIEAAVSNEEEAAELRCWFPSELVAQQHLERFLQTARLDPAMHGDVFGGALKLSMEAFRIRVENRVRCIFDQDYFPEGFADLMARCVGFQCGGTSTEGLPFVVLDLGKINPDLLAQAQAMHKEKPGLDFTLLWFVRMMEYITLVFLADRSRVGKPMYCVRPILIGRNFSMKLVGAAMRRWVSGLSKVGCDLYPLSFAELTVLHTPWIGGKVFSLAKPLLHPVTIEKIKLLSLKETEHWVGQMDAGKVPACIGGAARDVSHTFETRYPSYVKPLSSLSIPPEMPCSQASSRQDCRLALRRSTNTSKTTAHCGNRLPPTCFAGCFTWVAGKGGASTDPTSSCLHPHGTPNSADAALALLQTVEKSRLVPTSERYTWRHPFILFVLLFLGICGLLFYCEILLVASAFVLMDMSTQQMAQFGHRDVASRAEKSHAPQSWRDFFPVI